MNPTVIIQDKIAFTDMKTLQEDGTIEMFQGPNPDQGPE